jgi:hypothetical protein
LINLRYVALHQYLAQPGMTCGNKLSYRMQWCTQHLPSKRRCCIVSSTWQQISRSAQFKIYLENRGKSVSSAMREAGYADATAKNPKNLTGTQAWKDLLEKALPDKKLLTVHKKLLNAQKVEHMVFPLGMEPADIKKS